MQATAMRAAIRTSRGKGRTSRLRRAGFVPAVVYGRDKNAAMLSVKAQDLDKVLKLFGTASLIDLAVDGTKAAESFSKLVLIKNVQRDILSGGYMHVDLQEVSMSERVRVDVPVVIIGEDDRKPEAGVIQHYLREVSVSGLPQDLPARIVVDATLLLPGDAVRAGDLAETIGETVKIETPPDEVVIVVIHPHAVESTEPETESKAESEKPEKPTEGRPVEAVSPAVVKGGSEGDAK